MPRKGFLAVGFVQGYGTATDMFSELIMPVWGHEIAICQPADCIRHTAFFIAEYQGDRCGKILSYKSVVPVSRRVVRIC